MDLAELSPDGIVLWQWGFVRLNMTIAVTWAVMLLMVLGSWFITRRLRTDAELGRWQNLLEIIVMQVRRQIHQVTGDEPDRYLPFIGTLFLFIAVANGLMVVPGYVPPTASLSTTTALAICVFIAVPVFGVLRAGVGSYLRRYLQPSPFMLPFNILGELSRTLALAVRLFGNVLSGTKVAAIMVAIVPLIFPVVMQALGLLTGLIQAYIFAILALVYVAAGARVERPVTHNN